MKKYVFSNEFFLDQKDAADKKCITDINFTVFGKTQKKYHICSELSVTEVEQLAGLQTVQNNRNRNAYVLGIK